MKKSIIAAGVLATVIGVAFTVVVIPAYRARDLEPEAGPPPVSSPGSAVDDHEGFLYGRVTTVDGETYEGRLRFGGDEEAFWDEAFNGTKDENHWADDVPPERITERRPIEVFGLEIGGVERRINLRRPFMARFGDISRIEALDEDIRVTLKSGTVFDLDRFSADDLADGLRIWDQRRGVVDLDEWQIRTVEFLPTVGPIFDSDRLHGTVHTRQGDFSGFIQWNLEKGAGTDELVGYSADEEVRVRFDTIASIRPNSGHGSRLTLSDGRELVLNGTQEVGDGFRGVYVNDPRYGRVLVSRNALQRVEFSLGGNGPGFDDFPPGRLLEGTVTTRSGERLSGRLVYDLDETETTETLDAPIDGVDYMIPFGRIASILPEGRVTLRSGEELELARSGDLTGETVGVLVFVDASDRMEFVDWSDVERIDFD